MNLNVSNLKSVVDDNVVIFENDDEIYKEFFKDLLPENSIDLQKKEFEEYKKTEIQNIRFQQMELRVKEARMNADMDVIKKELELRKQAIKYEQMQLENDKEQFKKYKEREEQKIANKNDDLNKRCQRFKKMLNDYNNF